jgi:hypothetical protein
MDENDGTHLPLFFSSHHSKEEATRRSPFLAAGTTTTTTTTQLFPQLFSSLEWKKWQTQTLFHLPPKRTT